MATHSDDQVRSLLRALAFATAAGTAFPVPTIGVELDDDVIVAFHPAEMGLHAVVYAGGAPVGAGAHLAAGRVSRIVDALNTLLDARAPRAHGVLMN